MRAEKRISKTSPRARNLIAFSSLIMLLFCVMVGVQATRSYDTSIAQGKVHAERLARIVSDQAELTFLSVDLALRRAVEKQYFNALFGGNLPHYMEQNFRMWVNETPQIIALMITDDKGNIQIAAHKKGYERWIDYRASLADDPLFEQLKEMSDEGVAIGTHEAVGPQGQSLILMSRKLNKLDGSFGGVVVAAIDPAYFIDFFNSVELGEKRFMALVMPDNPPLVAGPDRTADNLSIVDEVLKSGRAKRNAIAGFSDANDAQGVLKIFAYKPLQNFPVKVIVTLDEKDFLADWRSGRLKDIGFLAIFMIFGSVLSFFALTLAKQIAQVEESEASAILASQAKSEFLANMSHELRTPLNAIIGFSEMMSAGYFGPLNPKQKERVHDINLCGTHLLQLISDILEFSKGDAGKLELVEEKVDVGEIVKESLRIMSEKSKAKQILVSSDVDERLPMLWADKRKIRQILLNLLTNAIKFTPDGGTVKATARLDQHGNLNLIVTDTGIGIAEEDIPIALSVFGQVHHGQTYEGTGLGLPLCKMFAELHGGKLILTSQPGEGTTVRILFPAARVLGEES
jgi:signal transduction histidine kinase